MAFSSSMAEFVLDQLSDEGLITTKKMFGALAFYQDGVLFRAVMEDRFALRAVAANEGKYLDAGMERHVIHGRKQKMPYFDLPADILENLDQLIRWVHIAYSK